MKYRVSTVDNEFKTTVNSRDEVRKVVSEHVKAVVGKYVSILPWRLVHLEVLNALCQEQITFIRETDDLEYCLYWFIDGEYKDIMIFVLECND